MKFIDDKFIPSTMDGNIHFSSYEYFKKLEEDSNDKGKSDKNENAEYKVLDPKKDILFIRRIPKGSKSLGATNLKGAIRLDYDNATFRTSYPKEDKEYGIASFTVIDPDKDLENGKIKADFINDVSEISNNRRALLFSEYDLKESLNKFASNKELYNVMYGNVEYTNNNNGRRNGFQKDLRFSNQHEWRIRINMDALNSNGDIFLPGLNIDLADNLERIIIIDK